jgi:subtilisin family serine protease
MKASVILCAAAMLCAGANGVEAPDSPESREAANSRQDQVPAKKEEFVLDEVLVGFQPGAAAEQKEKVRGAIGAAKLKEFARINVQRWKLPRGLSVERAIEILSANPNVRFAEPNYKVRANQVSVPNDDFLGELWGMHNIGQDGGKPDADIDALEVWQLAPGAGGVVVGIIDTGIDGSHPDLAAQMWVNPHEIPGNSTDDDGNGYIDDVRGWDFINNDNDPSDDNAHGTHVAGTIAGTGGDGEGVIGVAGLNPNVKLVALKFLDNGGGGDVADAVSAVLYAATLKNADGSPAVRMTNNSWSGGGTSETMKAAIAASNALFIAAAGNDSFSGISYPAGYALPNVIAVAATNSRDNLAWFSNYGSWVHLAAPGESVVSSTPGNTYSRYDGTSMACPHVVGAAALLLSQNPTWDLQAIKDRLLATADPVTALAGKTSAGTRLNVAAALGAAPLEDDLLPPPGVTNLVSGQITQTTAELSWDPLADSTSAYLFEVRSRKDGPLSESNWNSSTPVSGEPGVQSVAPGFVVENLAPGTQYFFGIRVVNWSGVPSAVATIAATPPADGSIQTLNLGWRPETVDRVGDPYAFRSFVSLALNGNGIPLLTYSDPAGNRMKMATRSGTSWLFETIGNDYGGVSLAMDPAGRPTFAWLTATNLNFSAKPSTKWSTTAIERSGTFRYNGPSLAYSGGNPAISYRLATGGHTLKYAARTGTTWKSQVVESGVISVYTSLAFHPSTSVAAIAYFAQDASTQRYALKLAESTSTGWNRNLVQGGFFDAGTECSIAFDPAGNPVITHSSDGTVRVHRRGPVGWSEQVVDFGYNCDLHLNGDKAWIAYASSGGIKVARAVLPTDPASPASWTIQFAEVDGPGSGRPSIRQTGTGSPYLAYFVGTELRLTKEDPTYPGVSYIFSDDMESPDNGNWQTEGDKRDPTVKTKPPGPSDDLPGGDGNLWHRTSDRRATDPGHSPSTSWYYGDETAGNYDTGVRNWGRLFSRPIPIPTGSRAELNVAHLAALEGSRWENGEIQISVNGGSWTTLLLRANRSTTTFATDTIDLTPYLGKTVRIAFFVDTKDAGYNAYEGWYVDDVSVRWWP